MYPELFHIGPVTLYSYGLMIALGFLAAVLSGLYRTKRLGKNTDIVWGIAVYGIIGGILGAKLLYIIIDLPAIFANPSKLLDIGNGFVVYGGIIGGILTAWVYCRIKKTEFLPWLDLLIPSVALAQGFGRIGCFLAGCCYGMETDAWYGVTFHSSQLAPNGVGLIPTQLLSSAGDFAIALFLIWQYKRRNHTGQIAENYLLLYSVGRFLVEILRNDPRGGFWLLSTSQWISILIFLFGILWKIWNVRRQKARPEEQQI